MSQTTVQTGELVEWHVATRPIAGEAIPGDVHLVKLFSNGVLLAAIDGVGHGAEATSAALIAAAVLEKHAQESVISLVTRCHEALAQTRGAVMTIASLNALENTLTWLGVGNVEGLLLRADTNASHPFENVLLRGGLVGYQLPALHASVLSVTRGDLLIFATDGIRSDFADGANPNDAPKHLAPRILQRHFKGTDDGMVLVVRYLGAQHE